MADPARAYWESFAPNFRIVPPMAPSPEDVSWMEGAAARCLDGTRSRALLLGVTPALIGMRWPSGAQVTVADWARAMFAHRWPDTAAAQAKPLVADWRKLPLAGGGLDLVCGDGFYTALGDSADVPRVDREVARVLARGGKFCMRCFVLPAEPVSPDRVCEWLRAGQLRNPTLFRWLFAMAVHGESARGAAVGEIWAAWRERFPDPEELRRGHGWNDEALAGFERWRGKPMRYCFHTLAQLEALAAEDFRLEQVDVPGYEFGERFPRLLFSRR